MEFKVTNVNEALEEAGHYLDKAGVEETSRNGKVLVLPEPVILTYTFPMQRVLFSPLRDANPFFHLMESLWMLAGRNDIAFPVYFNSKFSQYSDDGVTQPAAYGARWRNYFGYDQLALIVEELRKNSNSRRAVLTMWDGGCNADHPQSGEDGGTNGDLRRVQFGTKDAPCNTHVYFNLRGGELNMTVCNRSNDLIWGMLGANAVHFSVLLEYLAFWLGVPAGTMTQFSNNVHFYPDNFPSTTLYEIAVDAGIHNRYEHKYIKVFPLVNTDIRTWDEDLSMFFGSLDSNTVAPRFKDVFFFNVVWPMWCAWRERKEKRGDGLSWARLIAAEDWRTACVEWIVRREARKQAK
jgi:thymidylate synthase